MQLPVGSYRNTTPAASARQLVNCYSQRTAPEQPKGQTITLERPPGILAFADTTETECRGYTFMGNILYVCAGTSLYSLTSAGTLTELTGDAITGTGLVRMANNGTSIVIVVPDSEIGFSSNGSTVSAIADATFTGWGAIDVAYTEGYFVFVRPDTAQIFNPDVDSLTFNALKITTANGAPDNLLAISVNRGELMLAGTQSFERWYDAGLTPGSPFSRSPNGLHGIGCAAGKSLTTNSEDVTFMLAADKTFRQFSGSWAPISHAGIDGILQGMSTVSDCYAMPYSHGGHQFIAWTLPNGGRTLVYDMNTQEWHERESRIATVSIGRWRPAFIAQAWGKQIVGDSQSGKIGVLDANTFEEWGEPQRMEWTYPNVYAPGRGVAHRRLEIGMAAGQGTATGQGQNPLLTLYVSDDGGNTFRARPTREIGRMGEYRRRIQYSNCGMSADRVYRCAVSDPARTVVLDTNLDADGARL
jgi:hypothetical protein